jgi:hypothetical protein
MSSKQTSCEICAWAQTCIRNDKTIQTGCAVGQLDKYIKLKERADPKGHAADNAIFKLTETGDKTYYVINLPCPFQRAPQWVEDLRPDLTALINVDNVALREEIFKVIPFDYGLVVISHGGTKGTIRTCKAGVNQTVPPQFLKVVYPYKFKDSKDKEDLFLALQDRIGKDIVKPDEIQAPNFGFQIRQVVNTAIDNQKDMVLDAIQGATGYFWLLVLQEGSRMKEDFMESIKRQVLDELLDFHVISISPDEAIIVQPVLVGTAEFAHWACFILKHDKLVQEFNPNYIRPFFNLVEEKK